jgi:hypothetical protein
MNSWICLFCKGQNSAQKCACIIFSFHHMHPCEFLFSTVMEVVPTSIVIFKGFNLIAVAVCVNGLKDFQKDRDQKNRPGTSHFMQHDQDVDCPPFLICPHVHAL